MSNKNSRINKMARREFKKMDNDRSFHNKESKWIKTSNKYGLLEYQLMMLPTKPKFGINN